MAKEITPDKIMAVGPLSVELHLAGDGGKRRECVEPSIGNDSYVLFFKPQFKRGILVVGSQG